MNYLTLHLSPVKTEIITPVLENSASMLLVPNIFELRTQIHFLFQPLNAIVTAVLENTGGVGTVPILKKK